MGTESNGRDMLAVLLVGAPRSLSIGLIAASIGMLIGILLGFTAGYMGGWVDTVIRTISDSIITGEATTAEERQTSFTNMMKIALSLA